MDYRLNAEAFCFGCMEEKQGVVCPECGFDSRIPQEEGFLPYGTVLSGKYLTGRILDANSDGVSYIGFDTVQKEKVIIREYFPGELSFRDEDGLTVQILEGCDMPYLACFAEFKRLWRDLARLKNLSCLFAVYDIFEENQTIYAVSEYRDFIPLHQYLLNRTQGPMRWKEIRAKFMPVLSTLDTIHAAGLVHGGISPETLVLCDDKRIRLYGFSIRDVRTENGALSAQLFPGYAAIEQYGIDSRLEPCTDIYGFAAVLYHTLTGNHPPEAQSRVTHDRLPVPARVAEVTPPYVLSALGNAMQILPAERTPNVERFRAEISAAPCVTMSEPLPEAPQEPEFIRNENRAAVQRSGRKPLNPMVISLVITLVIGAVICAATAFFLHSPDRDAAQATTAESTTQAKIAVPNLISQDYLEVRLDKQMAEQFTFVVEEEFNELDEGTIFDQLPSAGTPVAYGSEIKLKVSKGVEKIILPSVVSYKKQDALDKLRELGFVCEVIEKYNNGDYTKGHVAGTDIPAEKEYPKGTQVVVFVWGDPPQNNNG